MPVASNTVSYRIRPLFRVAVPVWHCWQEGCCSQPVRSARPTAAIPPWQLWHCIASVPSVATAAPMTPRRHFVAEPGWHR